MSHMLYQRAKLAPVVQCGFIITLNAIPKIKVSCNLRCVNARLSFLCLKLLTAQQLEPRFKTAKVVHIFGMAYSDICTTQQASIRHFNTAC